MLLQLLFDPFFGFSSSLEFVLKLFFANFGQELTQGGAGLHAHREKVVARQERRVNFGLFFEFFGLFNEIVIHVQSAMGADAVEAMKLELERERGAH